MLRQLPVLLPHVRRPPLPAATPAAVLAHTADVRHAGVWGRGEEAERGMPAACVALLHMPCPRVSTPPAVTSCTRLYLAALVPRSPLMQYMKLTLRSSSILRPMSRKPVRRPAAVRGALRRRWSMLPACLASR